MFFTTELIVKVDTILISLHGSLLMQVKVDRQTQIQHSTFPSSQTSNPFSVHLLATSQQVSCLSPNQNREPISNAGCFLDDLPRRKPAFHWPCPNYPDQALCLDKLRSKMQRCHCFVVARSSACKDRLVRLGRQRQRQVCWGQGLHPLVADLICI